MDRFAKMGSKGATCWLILVGCVSSSAQCAQLSDVVNEYRNSVIYVLVQKAAGNTGAVTELHGTGFVVNEDGFVLTAAHVVSGGAGIQVDVRGAHASREGALEAMEVLYENSNFDVAVLRFKNSAVKRKAVSLGDPWLVSDAATVYAMGFPGKEEWFHTEGKLSGKGPKGSWNTTAVLNPGMSGGPVFDVNGKVVAMTWGGVPTEGVSGISRVLPINLLTDALRIAGIVSGNQGGLPPAPARLGKEVSYKFDDVQTTLGGAVPATKSYERVFQAEQGYKIIDHKYVAKSENNATVSAISLSPDGKRLSVKYSLKSGPFYDQWRGWIDAEILTRQQPE